MGAVSKVFTGARCRFKVGESFVGYALGCTGSSGINYTPIQGLGHLEVIEHAPSAFVVEMTTNLSRVVLDSAGKGTRLAGADFTGTSETMTDSPQIMPAFGEDGMNILKSGELTSYIYDRVTEKSLYSITGCKASQKSFDCSGAGAVAENVTWVARIMHEFGFNDAAIGI